jgi:DNA-binding MarR family transcriptional regulator
VKHAGARKASPEQDLYVLLQKAADRLARDVEALLKPHGLAAGQYNVLRILRGAGPEGLSCVAVIERMITRDPDMTRLLARLEQRGLVRRSRGREDRRQVRAAIEEEGLRLLKDLDGPVAELHERQFRHLGGKRVRALAKLLSRATGE